jgi:hypothetical protein
MQSTPTEPAQADSTIIRTGSDGRLRYSQTQRQELLDMPSLAAVLRAELVSYEIPKLTSSLFCWIATL